MFVRKVTIKAFEKGIRFVDGEPVELLDRGNYFLIKSAAREEVRIFSERDVRLADDDLDLIMQSGILDGYAEIVDVLDNQRALVWIDGRFKKILMPGKYALWNKVRDVRVEVVSVDKIIFDRKDAVLLAEAFDTSAAFTSVIVDEFSTGLLYVGGKFFRELKPGTYYFWKKAGYYSVKIVSYREQTLNISGQDIMTADKVTLRLNTLLTFQISDALKSVTVSDNMSETLYRETQLALRKLIGRVELDTLLYDKTEISAELESIMMKKSDTYGAKIISLGIKDIILPGEMKDLLNKVTEAKKAAEADLIRRREETAAVRSQLNAAKLLADNPVLMRLKELETVERIAQKSSLNIILGEKGLADSVTKLI